MLRVAARRTRGEFGVYRVRGFRVFGLSALGSRVNRA